MLWHGFLEPNGDDEDIILHPTPKHLNIVNEVFL